MFPGESNREVKYVLLLSYRKNPTTITVLEFLTYSISSFSNSVRRVGKRAVGNIFTGR